MASVQEIAGWIVEAFQPKESCTVERISEQVLLAHGCSAFVASTEASQKAKKVLAMLQRMNPESLPFEFSDNDSRRLIGKQRTRKGDSPETNALRQRITLIPSMLEAVYNCDHLIFEQICAGLMHLSGANDSIAICSRDEGGIDIYGRIPLGSADQRVHEGILHTSLLDKQILFLGQCKRYKLSARIGRPDIDAFYASTAACLNKYEGNARPPSNRVPPAYYQTRETCVRVFFTTTDYTNEAREAAKSHDIVLVNGQQIAQFLVYHQIATVKAGGVPNVDGRLLCSWAHTYSKPA
jgi:hypothetical protein